MLTVVPGRPPLKVRSTSSQVFLQVFLQVDYQGTTVPDSTSSHDLLQSSLSLTLRAGAAELELHAAPVYGQLTMEEMVEVSIDQIVAGGDGGSFITYEVELQRDTLVRFERVRNAEPLVCGFTVQSLWAHSTQKEEEYEEECGPNLSMRAKRPCGLPELQITSEHATGKIEGVDGNFWIDEIIREALGRRSIVVEVVLPECVPHSNDKQASELFDQVFEHLEAMMQAARTKKASEVFMRARLASDLFYEKEQDKLFMLLPTLKEFINYQHDWKGKNQNPWSKRWGMLLHLRNIINEGHHSVPDIASAMFVAVELPPVLCWFIQHATEMINSKWTPSPDVQRLSSSPDSDLENETPSAPRLSVAVVKGRK
jgi:hypothetical protein